VRSFSLIVTIPSTFTTMLFTTQDLASHLNDPAWVVFDCRHDLVDKMKGETLYREGHIPGAHFVRVEVDLSGEKTGTNGRHPLPAPETFLAFLARHGVTPASTIVAYDDAGGLYAARLWWMARWVGLQTVGLLDGGLTRWIAETRHLSTDVPTPTGVSLTTARLDTEGTRDAAYLLSHLGDKQTLIVDARAPERYRGDIEPIDKVAGHIPGSVNRFYKGNLNANSTFRQPDELKRDFETLLNGALPESVVHQCGSGITACANLFAMEYAGLKGSKLYVGSWSEWIADPSRPVTKEPKA